MSGPKVEIEILVVHAVKVRVVGGDGESHSRAITAAREAINNSVSTLTIVPEGFPRERSAVTSTWDGTTNAWEHERATGGTPDFDAWYEAGRAAGFIGEGFCGTHDGAPFTKAEAAEYDTAGYDTCTPSVRVFPDGDAPSGETVAE